MAAQEDAAVAPAGVGATDDVPAGPVLTGIPQIDYIWDPNLPRELNGHNLSTYPFYRAVPDKMEFNCDGRHDGFYANVAHHCQVHIFLKYYSISIRTDTYYLQYIGLVAHVFQRLISIRIIYLFIFKGFLLK